jgi:predicted nucleic acid-binding protein
VARSKKIALVDASVAVKWFNLEDDSGPAISLLNDYRSNKVDLIAPYLLIYEVGNALRYNPDFGENDVREALHYLESLQLNLRLVSKEDIDAFTSTAFQLGLTIYDSIYLALAKGEDHELFTADEKSLAKSNLDPKFHHIRDYKSRS